MNWKVFVGLVIVAVGALIIVYRVYNKPHKDIASAKVDYSLQLSVLIDEFESNADEAGKKYSDKVLAIEGSMQNLEEGKVHHLFLSDGEMGIANCEMLEKNTEFFQEGENIKIKGLFVGYDDLIEPTVTLKKCSVLN